MHCIINSLWRKLGIAVMSPIYGTQIAQPIDRGEEVTMIVTAGLGILVVFCLLLSMLEKPPAVGR
jgi:hypothetical protein